MSSIPKTASDRSFGLVFAAVFALVGLHPLLDGPEPSPWWLLAAAALLPVALWRPGWLAPGNRLWTRFGLLLNRFTAPLVMGVLFLTVVTPIGLLMRLLGQRPLRLSYEPEADSYWIVRQSPTPDSMKRPF
ncbi:MAG: SxtJ family membrane protein [Magnetococcus sp. DMHC-8]